MTIRIALTAGIAGALLALPAAAQNAAIACADLAAQYAAPEVVITSATLVPAIPSGGNAGPEHCDVRGMIHGNIKFAVFMPTAWNERFQMVGNGGKAGSISLGDMRAALRLGYASRPRAERASATTSSSAGIARSTSAGAPCT